MTLSDDALVTQQADVLSEEELEQAYERWEAPHMVSVSDVEQGSHTLLTVAEIETLHKEAQQEGFKEGYEEGHQAGHEVGLAAAKLEIDALKQHWQYLIDHLATPLEMLDETVENDLLKLSISLARQLVGAELTQQPEHILLVMRSALAALPINDRKLKVFLNPLDIELVKAGLSLDHEETRWQWIEDPLLARGGVRLETADTTVDATVEARLAKLIDKMLGGEMPNG